MCPFVFSAGIETDLERIRLNADEQMCWYVEDRLHEICTMSILYFGGILIPST